MEIVIRRRAWILFLMGFRNEATLASLLGVPVDSCNVFSACVPEERRNIILHAIGELVLRQLADGRAVSLAFIGSIERHVDCTTNARGAFYTYDVVTYASYPSGSADKSAPPVCTIGFRYTQQGPKDFENHQRTVVYVPLKTPLEWYKRISPQGSKSASSL